MDKTFFVQELEAHSGMLYRVAWTILRNDDACQDAMQEAALKAWESAILSGMRVISVPGLPAS